jgi:hypothetical protein
MRSLLPLLVTSALIGLSACGQTDETPGASPEADAAAEQGDSDGSSDAQASDSGLEDSAVDGGDAGVVDGSGGCKGDVFDCGNDKCVSTSLLCDGQDDCGNWHDEGAEGNCTASCACSGCCMADGTCGAGDSVEECGAEKQWCDNCKAEGLECNWSADGTEFKPRCTTTKPDGSPCVDGADCESFHCSDANVCYSPCVADRAICWQKAKDTCCVTDQSCEDDGSGTYSCCFPAGHVTSDCYKCCNLNGCLQQGSEYHCAK